MERAVPLTTYEKKTCVYIYIKQIVERELVRSHLTGVTVPLKDNGPGSKFQNKSTAIFLVYETRMAKFDANFVDDRYREYECVGIKSKFVRFCLISMRFAIKYEIYALLG